MEKLTQSKEVTADKEDSGRWEHPDPQQVEDIDKVAQAD